jgi:photosystem II stability/assembly factor-like uncharacterized protein
LFLAGALLLAGCGSQPAPTNAPGASVSLAAATAISTSPTTASPTAVECTSTPTPQPAYPPLLVQPAYPPPASPTIPPPAACSAQITASIVPLVGAVNQGILDYSFVDAQHGWVSTDTALLATEDGGQTWQERAAVPQTQQWEPDQAFDRIDFISTQEGFAAIHYTTLVHTLDGGRTWQALPALVPPGGVFRLDFVDRQHGWATTNQPALLRSRDGGLTWQPLTGPCLSLNQYEQINVTFLDANSGWATCHLDASFGLMVNALYSTQDGGDHWEKLAEAPGDFPVNSTPTAALGWLPELDYDSAPSFSDLSHGWLTAGSGQLYTTEDGGHAWQLALQSMGTPYFSSPHRFDSSSGMVLAGAMVGGKTGPALLKTIDGGHSWVQILPNYYPDHASYLDARVGYGVDGMRAALGANRVYRTGDGGRTWNVVATLPDPVFNPFQVQFVDALHGWVIAQDCPLPANQEDCDKIALYRTQDGGQIWERLWPHKDSEIAIDAMAFVSPTEGYLMGNLADGSGRGLYFSRDGGQTLEPVLTPADSGSMTFNAFLYGLQYQFLAARVGYGANRSGLFYTQDGARAWQAVPAACLYDSISFASTGVFSLGRDGSLWVITTNISNSQDNSASLISSVDGGRTWQSMVLPGMVVTEIQFVDAQHGWLRGGAHTRYQGGYLFGADHTYATDDGGRIWTQLN